MIELKLTDIVKRYDQKSTAFKCQHLEIRKGQKIGIAGETGSGKSTMLKIIAGLEKPNEGSVYFRDENVFPKLDRLIPGHPDMAYLSQSFELPRFIRVEEFLNSRPSTKNKIKSISELCRINEFLNKDTSALSGGEKQRVALAKVLLEEPVILLLDEPYSNLDPNHKRTMKEVIDKIGGKMDTTILLISHEPMDLLPWSDEILILGNGAIQQKGSPKEIYYHPRDEYIAGLFGAYQLIDPRKWNLDDTKTKLVRPDFFQLNNHGEAGTIKEIKFKGAYEELTVLLNNQEILVESISGRYQQGDSVQVSVNPAYS